MYIKGEMLFQREDLPEWVKNVIVEADNAQKDYNSLDDVREKYRKLRNKEED